MSTKSWYFISLISYPSSADCRFAHLCAFPGAPSAASQLHQTERSHLSVSASSSVLPRRLQAGCSTPAAPLATSAPQTRQHTARHIPGAPRSSIGTSRRIKRRQTY